MTPASASDESTRSGRVFTILLDVIPQHLVENTTVSVVVDLDRCVDTADGGELDGLTILTLGGHLHLLQRLQGVINLNIEGLWTVQTEALMAFSFSELQRKNSHADQ